MYVIVHALEKQHIEYNMQTNKAVFSQLTAQELYLAMQTCNNLKFT